MLTTPFAQAATASPAPSATTPATKPAPLTPEQQGILDALAKAKATGKPAPVDALTTETSQTVVNPDGKLTTSANAQPARVKRAGKWTALDPTLHKNADGTISPAATSNGLSVSGGGTGPVATVTTDDGKKLAVTAPFALPAPTLNGAVATYANVLPDVDLQVTALSNGGWRDVIVVRTAAAAADPKLAKLHFPISATGLKVAGDAAGNVNLTDSSGKVRLQAPAPMQWDSSTAPTTPVAQSRSLAAAPEAAAPAPAQAPGSSSSAAGPGDHAVQAPIAIQASDGGFDLTPDPTTFGKGVGPWYLDPTVSANSSANAATQVQEYFPDSKYYSTAQQDLGVGYCGYSDCPSHGRERAYFQIAINSAIYTQPGGAPSPPTVYGSTFSANVDGASSPGTSTPLGLYWTGPIDGNTTWNNQPCNGGSTMGGCSKVGSTWITGTGPIGYDVTSQMQQAAAGKWGNWTVGIAPDDENNMYYRHHIQSNAQINTTYDLQPSMWYPRTSPSPGFANGDGRGNPTSNTCAPDGNSAGWVGANQNLGLTAAAWSPIGANLNDTFHVWNDAGWSNNWYTAAPSYGDASVNVPGNQLVDGHLYAWTASATDGTLTSPGTGACFFKVDRTPPTVSVSSTDFPPSGTPNPTPTKFNTDTGTFTITGNDPLPASGGGGNASGLACFKVSTSSTPVTGWHCNDPGVLLAVNGSASYSYVPGKWGTNTLYAQAQDNAGNYSQPTAYNFYAPWNPTSKPVFGDLTGDGKPDITLPDGTGNLRVIQNTGDPVNAGWVSALGITAPGGTWNGLQITHRSTLRTPVFPADDLIVHKPGDPMMYLYTNTGQGTYGQKSPFYPSGSATPSQTTCVDTSGQPVAPGNPGSCPTGVGYDFSQVTQVLALGNPDNEVTTAPLSKTALVVVINGSLWLMPPGGSAVLLKRTDTQLSTGPWDGSNNTDGYDLIGPGPANGPTSWTPNGATTPTIVNQATLWARDRKTGQILAYPITKNADGTTNYTALADPTKGTVIYTGVDTTTYPVVGSVGDFTGDGIPDLYAQNAAGKIVVWPGVIGDPAAKPGAVSSFGTSNVIGDARAPQGRYLLAGPTNTTTDTTHTPDFTGQHPGTITGDVTFGATTLGGAASSAATFNSTSANNGEVDAPGLQVDTTKSFSITTWAREDQSTDGVVLSQDGAHTSDFMLWPGTDANGTNWRFAMTTNDNSGVWQYDQTTQTANGADRVQIGAWTKLTVSYNATTGQMAVYVNGALAATGTHTTKVAAASTSSLVIGRYFNNDAHNNPFKGAIADVAVYPFETTPGSTAGPAVSGVNTAKCMDENGGVATPGAHIQVWDCNGSAAQQWTFNQNGTVNLPFGGCMDATNAGTTNGTPIQWNTCNGNPAQQFIPRADGSLYNPVSGRCVDDPASNITNGTQLGLWDCYGSVNQTWTLTPNS